MAVPWVSISLHALSFTVLTHVFISFVALFLYPSCLSCCIGLQLVIIPNDVSCTIQQVSANSGLQDLPLWVAIQFTFAILIR